MAQWQLSLGKPLQQQLALLALLQVLLFAAPACGQQYINIALCSTDPYLEMLRTGNVNFSEYANPVYYLARELRQLISGFKFLENTTNLAGGIKIGAQNYLLNITTISIPVGSNPAEAKKVFNGSYGGPWQFVFGGYDSGMNMELALEASKMPSTLLMVPYPSVQRSLMQCVGPGNPGPTCYYAGQRRFNNTIWTYPVFESSYNVLADRVAAQGGKTAAIVWQASAREDPFYANMAANINTILPVIYQQGIRALSGGAPNTTFIAKVANDLVALDPDLLIFFDRTSAETFWNITTQQKRWLPRALSMPNRPGFPGNFSFLIDTNTVSYWMKGPHYNETLFFPQRTPTSTSSHVQIRTNFSLWETAPFPYPSWLSFWGYTTAYLFVEAVTRSQSLDPAVIQATLEGDVPFQTVLGPFKFDGYGLNVLYSKMMLQGFPGQTEAKIVFPDSSKQLPFEFVYPIPFGCIPPHPGPAFYCDRDLKMWISNSSITFGINGTASAPVKVEIGSPVIVRGNVTLTTTVLLQVPPQGSVQSTECVTIEGGQLEIPVSARNYSSTGATVEVFVSRAGCLSGQLTSISATDLDESTRSCSKLTTTSTYSSRDLSVALAVDMSGCDGLPGWGIGVIVGGSCLILLVAILIMAFVPAIRARLFPWAGANKVNQQRLMAVSRATTEGN